MTPIEEMTNMVRRAEDDYTRFNELLFEYRSTSHTSDKNGLQVKLDALETILIEGSSVQTQLYLIKYFILTKVMKDLPLQAVNKLKVRLTQLDELREGVRSAMFPLVEASKGIRERHFDLLEETKKMEFRDTE